MTTANNTNPESDFVPSGIQLRPRWWVMRSHGPSLWALQRLDHGFYLFLGKLTIGRTLR